MNRTIPPFLTLCHEMVHGISVDYILKTHIVMKIIICDVGDAACAFLTSPNAYTMMIDCGSSDNKTNPVDIFKSNIFKL